MRGYGSGLESGQQDDSVSSYHSQPATPVNLTSDEAQRSRWGRRVGLAVAGSSALVAAFYVGVGPSSAGTTVSLATNFHSPGADLDRDLGDTASTSQSAIGGVGIVNGEQDQDADDASSHSMWSPTHSTKNTGASSSAATSPEAQSDDVQTDDTDANTASPETSFEIETDDLSDDASTALSFTAYNSYTETTPITAYMWDHIVEPHRETTFAVDGSGYGDDGWTYSWQITEGSLVTSLTGTQATYTFKKLGKHAVTLTASTTTSGDDASSSPTSTTNTGKRTKTSKSGWKSASKDTNRNAEARTREGKTAARKLGEASWHDRTVGDSDTTSHTEKVVEAGDEVANSDSSSKVVHVASPHVRDASSSDDATSKVSTTDDKTTDDFTGEARKANGSRNKASLKAKRGWLKYDDDDGPSPKAKKKHKKAKKESEEQYEDAVEADEDGDDSSSSKGKDSDDNSSSTGKDSDDTSSSRAHDNDDDSSGNAGSGGAAENHKEKKEHKGSYSSSSSSHSKDNRSVNTQTDFADDDDVATEDMNIPAPDDIVTVHKGEVMCKYVRREIRDLADSDRENFFDALHTVYTVSTNDGLDAGYGEKYHHISYYAQKHLAGAAARDCDHWHDGAGLMVHHMSFTLELEQTLQAVDPSVSVPYWDYTIDAYKYGDMWSKSPIFGEDWFGSASKAGDPLHLVSSGLWAYTPIMTNVSEITDVLEGDIVTNAYGQLRSPWNLNPTPYLTRWKKVFNFTGAGYQTFPDCSSMFQCFVNTAVSDMNECLNGDTHGPVHTMVGGQWHAAHIEEKVIHYYTAERIQLLVFKNLWRHGYADCPTDCDVTNETAIEDCQCSCPESLVAEKDPYDILNETQVLHWIDHVTDVMYFDQEDGRYHIKNLEEAHEEKQWHMILQGYCNPGYVGELFTSNAPADPLFWTIHTTAERLLNWKRVLNHLGKVDFDETWGYAHPADTPSDTGVVCDWTAVDEGEATLPTCAIQECEGHGENDVLPSGNFLGLGETYTNAQFYDLMDPYNEHIPYLYDTFTWSVCEAQGFRLSQENFLNDDDTISSVVPSAIISEPTAVPDTPGSDMPDSALAGEITDTGTASTTNGPDAIGTDDGMAAPQGGDQVQGGTPPSPGSIN